MNTESAMIVQNNGLRKVKSVMTLRRSIVVFGTQLLPVYGVKRREKKDFSGFQWAHNTYGTLFN